MSDEVRWVDDGGALISPCKRYRYRLWRAWSREEPVAFIMLNPSTADGIQDDPTIRRCRGFAEMWGAGGLIVGNLFAYRATDPRELRRVDDPVGQDNDAALRQIAAKASKVICAWGAHGAYRNRDREVLEILRDMRVVPVALSFTKDGHPRHPLYLSYSATPKPLAQGVLAND